MLKTEDIAVVILNWNGINLLKEFLGTVIKHSENAQIYVADNASTDESTTYILDNYPTVNLIRNTENWGYAKGYNEAIKHINATILCLLNNDVQVTKNWLKPIVETFNTDKNTAIIQPKILDHKEKTNFEYAGAAGGFIDKYGYPYCHGRIFNSIEKDNNQYANSKEILWASGACLFIKNKVFKALNGFDSTFFAHFEEIDLCWRAFNSNYKSTYMSTSVVYHVGGATLSNTHPKKTYLNFRNSLITLVKNTDKHVVSRTFIRMVLDGIAAFRFLFLLKPSHFFAVLKAHFSFYKRLPYVLKQRKLLPKKKGYYNISSIVWNYFVLKQKNTIGFR